MNTPFAKHQFKYTFNGSNEEVPVEVTFEVDGHTSLSQIIQQFEYYLKACGFYFDGHLDFVNDDLDDPLDWKEIASTIDDNKNEGCMTDWDKQFDNGLTTTSSPLDVEVAKNKWVHGICNPPMKNWKKEYE